MKFIETIINVNYNFLENNIAEEQKITLLQNYYKKLIFKFQNNNVTNNYSPRNLFFHAIRFKFFQ